MIGRFLDWFFGQRCALGCGQRLAPEHVAQHEFFDHAGDRR